MRMTAAIAVAIRTHTNLVLLRATGSSAAIHRISARVMETARVHREDGTGPIGVPPTENGVFR